MPRHPLYSHHHHQYIEQERILLFADELIVQPVFPPTNPGSLTMGFSGVDPRQLAPSVGTAQLGNAISAASSSTTLAGSMTRTVSNLFAPLGFTAHLPALKPVFSDLHS